MRSRLQEQFHQRGGSFQGIDLDIQRFWSLENKLPASSRRLATLPMMAQAERSGHGARRRLAKHRANRPSTGCAAVRWPEKVSRMRRIRHSVKMRLVLWRGRVESELRIGDRVRFEGGGGFSGSAASLCSWDSFYGPGKICFQDPMEYKSVFISLC